MDLELDDWKPEIDRFLDFKNRTVKKIKKQANFSGKDPDFGSLFNEVIGSLEYVEEDNGSLRVQDEKITEEHLKHFLEGIIGLVNLMQQYHELYIEVPDSFHSLSLNSSNPWIKLATGFTTFCSRLKIIKSAEVQEKYYLVLPLIERVLASERASNHVSMEKILLLILIYKIYTSILQKNKFLDDVEDLFALYSNHVDLFDYNNWKNPLLDNFHRMMVQVGLMLRRDDQVLSIIKHRLDYFKEIREKLVYEEQDPNMVLNIINVVFSISKNYLQLGDTRSHDKNLKVASKWLDEMMGKYPFTKKAWKLRVKMIRSLGHNALKRNDTSTCYLRYLEALVLSYNHKLQRETDRAMMYVQKYKRFFRPEMANNLKVYLEIIPDTLSKTHLLYLIGKSFTGKRNIGNSLAIQSLIVSLLKEEYNDYQLKLALTEATPEMRGKLEKILDLLTNNLNFLGNLYIKTKQIDRAINTFQDEASLYDSDNPRKQLKIYMKIAKEFKRVNRFRESIEFAEKAFYLASEHEINDHLQKILEFLIEACKLGNNFEKLANFKKLLYQV